MKFLVNWSIGGQDEIEAPDEVEARKTMLDLLPLRGDYDWHEIEIAKAAQ